VFDRKQRHVESVAKLTQRSTNAFLDHRMIERPVRHFLGREFVLNSSGQQMTDMRVGRDHGFFAKSG
jgi:hypothetical protein